VQKRSAGNRARTTTASTSWFLLRFASAGVFHHAGIKIPFFAFFSHDSKIRCKEAPLNMLVAMAIAPGFCIFNGCFPHVFLYTLLPETNTYHQYDWMHVITQTQLLFWSALAFTILNLTHLYPPELPGVHIDVEWSYRKGGKGNMWLLENPLGRLAGGSQRLVLETIPRALTRAKAEVHAEERQSRGWVMGTAGFFAVVILFLYLLVDFLKG